jgi:lipopolysaccharide transport system permease protein
MAFNVSKAKFTFFYINFARILNYLSLLAFMQDTPKESEENWTLIVSPKTKWFDLHLSDLWRYRDLVMMFVKRDFVSAYKQTLLGPLWFVIQPLVATYLFLFVFSNIAHLSTGQIPPVLFYLSGLTVWNYFAICFNKTSNTFITNIAIFGKVYFPRLAAPFSTIISTLITFGIQFFLFLSFLIYYIFSSDLSFHLTAYLLLIPYIVIIMGALGLGAGIIISSLTTKYRDLTNLIAFGVQFLMYLTTVVYSLDSIKGKRKLIIMLNPMTGIIETFRFAFFPKDRFNWHLLGYSSLFTLFVLIIGVLLFNKTEKKFMDTV